MTHKVVRHAISALSSRLGLVLLTAISCSLFSSVVFAERCLFVSSYHQGYDWADGVERGVRSVLKDKCELRQINMDTKRHKDEAFIKAKALEVKQFIEEWQPDVVIAADDNASKYLVVPFYRDAELPIVFCGVNWTVEEYGYPYSNVTGMIEVSPIRDIFEKIQQILSNPRAGIYIGADTLTEKKSYERYRRIAQRYNIKLDARLSSTMQEWQDTYIDAQKADFLILGTKSGINDWDDEKALQVVFAHSQKLSITDYEWMVEFSLMGLTKVAEEQGRWAATTALKILAGAEPNSIPIIPNRDWDMYINASMLARTPIELPQYIILKSKMVYGE